MQSNASLFGPPPIGSVERRVFDLTRERFGVLIAVEIYRDRDRWHVRVLDDGTSPHNEIADVAGSSLTEALSLAEDALERWIDERQDEIAEGRAIDAAEMEAAQ